MVLGWLIGAVVVFFFMSVKIVYAYQRGVLFTWGKYSRIMMPGLRLVIPVMQSWERIDIRTRVIDVPDQECITKDNVSIKANAVLYFRVSTAEKAVIKVENFLYAISQLAQTTMRDVIGEVSLDELLSKRDMISNKIQQLVDKASDPWGVVVHSVDLKHIVLPDSLVRTIAKEAEAERERRAIVIKAQAEFTASLNV